MPVQEITLRVPKFMTVKFNRGITAELDLTKFDTPAAMIHSFASALANQGNDGIGAKGITDKKAGERIKGFLAKVLHGETGSRGRTTDRVLQNLRMIAIARSLGGQKADVLRKMGYEDFKKSFGKEYSGILTTLKALYK